MTAQQQAIQAEISRAKEERATVFESAITSEKAQAEQARQAQVTEARAKFGVEMSAQEARLKRQAMIRERRIVTPRELSAWRQEQTAGLEEAIQAQKSTYEEQIGTWEVGQREAFAKSQEQFGYDAQKELESQIQTSMEPSTGAVARAFRESEKTPPAEVITETITTYEYPPAPAKSLSEQIMETPAYWPEPLRPVEEALRMTFVRAGAGAIATFESFGYGLGGLLGLSVPAPPPTPVGGLISSGIESIMTGKPTESVELEKIIGYGPAYIVGSVAGEFLLTLGLSKALEPVMKPVSKVVSRKVVSPVKQAWRGSEAEMYLIEHSDWYRGVAAKTIKGTQVVGMKAPPSFIQDIAVGKGFQIGGEDFAWEMMQTPKTAGLFIRQAPAAAVKAPLRWDVRGLVRAGMYVAPATTGEIAGDLSFLGEAPVVVQPVTTTRQMVSATEQIMRETQRTYAPAREIATRTGAMLVVPEQVAKQVTRPTVTQEVMRILPAATRTAAKQAPVSLSSMILGTGLVSGVGQYPSRISTPRIEQISRVVTRQAQAASQAQRQKQVQKQIQRQIQTTVTVQDVVQTPVMVPTMFMPSGKPAKRLGIPSTDLQWMTGIQRAKGVKRGKGYAEYLFPELGVREAAKYVFGSDYARRRRSTNVGKSRRR